MFAIPNHLKKPLGVGIAVLLLVPTFLCAETMTVPSTYPIPTGTTTTGTATDTAIDSAIDPTINTATDPATDPQATEPDWNTYTDNPTVGLDPNSIDPTEAAEAQQLIDEYTAQRDATVGGPDYVPVPDASEQYPDDRADYQIWLSGEWGYQAMVPGQSAAKFAQMLSKGPRPQPVCPSDRNTGCKDSKGGVICCPAGQVAMGNACGAGLQLCCSKIQPPGSPACTQLMCRMQHIGGGGFICARNNFTCRDPRNSVKVGKCTQQAGGGPAGAGMCPCLAQGVPQAS